MRLQSKNKVRVGQTIIGGPKVLTCLPLVAETKTQMKHQAKELVSLKPDLLEWRIDSYENVECITSSLKTLASLRCQIGSIPLIFTCRNSLEGGAKKLAQEYRLRLINSAIQSGDVDIVDIELCNEPAFIDAIRTTSKAHGTKLILSYHDFHRTPEQTFIIDKLNQAQTQGANIAKLAVMPNGHEDVLTLLKATLHARTHGVQIPMITMSMGTIGRVTRIAGGLFGSDVTFAMGTRISAPGQIHMTDLVNAMNALYDE